MGNLSYGEWNFWGRVLGVGLTGMGQDSWYRALHPRASARVIVKLSKIPFFLPFLFYMLCT